MCTKRFRVALTRNYTLGRISTNEQWIAAGQTGENGERLMLLLAEKSMMVSSKVNFAICTVFCVQDSTLYRPHFVRFSNDEPYFFGQFARAFGRLMQLGVRATTGQTTRPLSAYCPL